MVVELMANGYEDGEIFASLNGVTKQWFSERFGSFSPAQRYSMIPIRNRQNILVSSPTGSGKTLSAFGSILNYLIELDLKGELEDKIYCVYVSPLKALAGDIEVNLKRPLEEMEKIAGKKLNVRIGLRTGDTTTSERAKMARKAPHILVTTPESLGIILTTKKFSENLNALEFVIVDEIHAMANKRGVYLSLCLERLTELSVIEPVRIGLSATIAPLEEVAKFLVGSRDCLLAEVKLNKKIDIGLLTPGEDLIETDNAKTQSDFYRILDELVESHKTTVIFTNTRAATERIIHYLDVHFPGKYSDLIGAHHSSMSKEKRFEIEDRLRKGELKVVVTSTSLELGIDIGSIDLVILVRSPKGVARALQRVGRAGHKLHENPKGRFIVMDRDDLVECGVLMKSMVEGKIDRVEFPRNALDVLAQHIYGMAISKQWNAEEMLALIRKSYCYSSLNKEDFYSVVSYLAGDYALEHRNVYAKIWYDENTGMIGKKGKMARVIYMSNIGTIPEEGFIEVVVNSPVERRGQSIGKIDEAFLERMKKGDVFVLGGQKYMFSHSKGMKAYVNADVSRSPTIPSWFSEMLPLSFDVGLDVAKFRRLVREKIKDKKKCIEFIRDYIYCGEPAAEQIYDYFYEQAKFSEIPYDGLIVVEKFKQEKDYLLFHTTYGRRVNDALSRAYGYAAGRARGRDVEIGVNDNGFYIAGFDLNEAKIVELVKSKDLEMVLKEVIERTDILRRRFRHCAGRALMILRSYKGRSKSVGKQQMHSHFLLSAVKRISNEFPILREARREVLEDVMDVKNAKEVLKWIESGKVKFVFKRLPFVSPFGLNLILQSHTDLIKIEDKIKFLKRMHEMHMKAIERK